MLFFVFSAALSIRFQILPLSAAFWLEPFFRTARAFFTGVESDCLLMLRAALDSGVLFLAALEPIAPGAADLLLPDALNVGLRATEVLGAESFNTLDCLPLPIEPDLPAERTCPLSAALFSGSLFRAFFSAIMVYFFASCFSGNVNQTFCMVLMKNPSPRFPDKQVTGGSFRNWIPGLPKCQRTPGRFFPR
jgi:hypothetical protein